MQRAKCGGGGSFARELEVIFQDTSLFTDTCFQRWSKGKGGAAASECRSTGSWELRLETEACLKSQDARLKLGKGSFSQRL